MSAHSDAIPEEKAVEPKLYRAVLIVDDESCVLNSLVRELRKEPYQILTATSGVEGLKILQDRRIAVIVSDMQMPYMNGIEFLTQAGALCPGSVNMVLSGHSDSSLVMSAINSGTVWRYLTKPWQIDELKVSIRNALEMHDANLEREQLLLELRRKNEELANWSGKLEVTVREQTRELYNQGVLLRMILDGECFSTLVPLLCSYLGSLFSTREVFFYLATGEMWLQSSGEVLVEAPLSNEDWESGQAAAMEQAHGLQRGRDIFYPLLNGGEYFGMIFVKGASDGLENVESYLDGYAAIAAIALRQQRLGQDSGAILSNIDAILGELQ